MRITLVNVLKRAWKTEAKLPPPPSPKAPFVNAKQLASQLVPSKQVFVSWRASIVVKGSFCVSLIMLLFIVVCGSETGGQGESSSGGESWMRQITRSQTSWACAFFEKVAEPVVFLPICSWMLWVALVPVQLSAACCLQQELPVGRWMQLLF